MALAMNKLHNIERIADGMYLYLEYAFSLNFLTIVRGAVVADAKAFEKMLIALKLVLF
jgi:hypothetical protein